MRYSWIRRGAVAGSTAMLAFQGALIAVAQFAPYGSQDQRYAQYQQPANPQYTAAITYPQVIDAQVASPALPQPADALPQYIPPASPEQTYPAPGQSDVAPAAGSRQAAPTVSYSEPVEAPAYQSYVGSGYDTSRCAAAYNTFSTGASYATGNSGVCYPSASLGGGRQWFGGVYGLYMERDGNPWKALAFSTLDTAAPGYYPADNEYVINLNDIDNDSFGGAEFRFGATFRRGGQLGCNCDCCCGPRYAWEVAYWGLVEDDQTVRVNDLIADGNRLYGMIDYRGIEYDGGGGYRPVNDSYDYGPPTQTPVVGADIIRVRSMTARNRFSAQNVEINLLRLPILCGGCGCAAGGACDTCASGSCGVRPRYSLTTLFGARYMRLDEDFMFRTDFENETATTFGFLSHNIDVENHLVGAQLGCNGAYHLGCAGCWALHCSTNVGVYGNHMEVWNRMDAPVGGTVRLANGGNEPFNFRYDDGNVAVIGELRLGCSYKYSCNWRFFGGYRLLGISGVALAFDQIAPANISPNQISYVDTDGSVFLHGLQAGVECTY